VKKLGIEAVRTLIVKERDALRLTLTHAFFPIEPWEETAPPRSARNGVVTPPRDAAYRRWQATNVTPQKQAGYVVVHVRLIRGDVTAAQLRAVARVAREHGDGAARSTNQQNIAVRFVPREALPAVYSILADVGLVAPGAERLVDITTCPGADTCQLGITSSRGLAAALTETIERELGDLADESGIRIKISGCPNSCGQHHLGSIGFYGGARKFHGQSAPTYQMLIGGRVGADPRFGRPIARVPARLVPDAVQTLLYVYCRDREVGEAFDAFVTRVGVDRLGELVSRWTELPPADETPEAYFDWDATEKFTPETGAGECAA
jgi:sulfite reductase (ferredoxin)